MAIRSAFASPDFLSSETDHTQMMSGDMPAGWATTNDGNDKGENSSLRTRSTEANHFQVARGATLEGGRVTPCRLERGGQVGRAVTRSDAAAVGEQLRRPNPIARGIKLAPRWRTAHIIAHGGCDQHGICRGETAAVGSVQCTMHLQARTSDGGLAHQFGNLDSDRCWHTKIKHLKRRNEVYRHGKMKIARVGLPSKIEAVHIP